MIVKIFFFWRLGLLLITYLGSITFPLVQNSGIGAVSPSQKFDFWASWAQWDGGHYFQIAKEGYTSTGDFAFFPLYPLLIKGLAIFLKGNLIFAGLIISNIAFILFLFIFYKLLAKKFSKNVAYYSTITFLVFPTSFFGVAYYSESLLLLMVVVTFFLLREREFLLASIATSLASVTRATGIFLAVSVFWSYLAQLKFNLAKVDRRATFLFLSFSAIFIYSLYLFINLNDPFKFLTAQSLWERSAADPVSGMFAYLWAFLTRQARPINDYFDLLATLFFLLVLIYGRQKIPSSWWIFSMFAILIPASTGTLTSMPRYLLGSVGTFVILGKYLENKPILRVFLWSVSLASQALLAVLFVNGYWVA